MDVKYTNYSNGYVVEYVPTGKSQCTSWLLLPAENLWPEGLRGFLYLAGMVYLFIGIAIASDAFMCAIEVITSKKRTVVRWDEERQERVTKQVLIWNETVANLTLMALGSSAPEILLATIEQIENIDKVEAEDGLGTFTIIGSAAYNLLMITAICILSVKTPDIKRVQEFGVFLLTAFWSMFAYVWMLIVLLWISPQEVEVWEAWLTISFFPIMVLMAYCQDSGWWCHRGRAVGVDLQSQTNIRIVSEKKDHHMMHGPSKELAALEHDKAMRLSHANIRAMDGSTNEISYENDTNSNPVGSQVKLVKAVPADSITQTYARARFRHAAVRSMMGGKKKHQETHKPKMMEVVQKVQSMHNLPTFTSDEELCGKFTFAAPSYSVLESAGILEINILFHRRSPSKSKSPVANGGTAQKNGGPLPNEVETSFTQEFTGVVTVDYETREGSAKIDKDYKHTQGRLTFKETEYEKTLAIPIINDNQYEADVDFYVIIKNPSGEAGLGDPSVCRVTIIDDDEPGEFLFEKPQVWADLKSGTVTATVMRQHGCDGTVTIEYSTIDGTARGMKELTDNADYETTQGELSFKHGETSKQITVKVNKKAKGSKNFIITLRNPSLGAKIGEHSAVVASLSSDDISGRIADVLDDDDDDDDGSWAGQFKGAMQIGGDTDDDGNEIPIKWYDYILHFVSFFWKVFCALIPPKKYLGAWPAFVVSLGIVALLTAFVKQLGDLLGCVLNIRPSVNGITIIALGTSVPDTFASRIAAIQDENADAAIGNITGSNSVNVFLGLGLPWVIQVMYSLAKNRTFRMNTENLGQSVILFSTAGGICIIILLLRRKILGGELGGVKKLPKYLTAAFLVFLWISYIVLASLKAYDILPWTL